MKRKFRNLESRDTRICVLYERNPELNKADLGRMFKISRERIRQIIAKRKATTVVKPS